MSDAKAKPRRRRSHPAFPVVMLALSAVFGAAFGLCHLAGLREHLPLIFATTRGDRAVGPEGVLLAGLYVTLYALCVVVVPIFLIAAGVYSAAGLLLRRRTGR